MRERELKERERFEREKFGKKVTKLIKNMVVDQFLCRFGVRPMADYLCLPRPVRELVWVRTKKGKK